MSGRAIDHRVERGRLLVLHRGVYAVGHRVLSREGRWMAAVLAVRPDGVLSHRSAAIHHGIRSGAGGRIGVTVPRWRRSRSGLLVYCSTLPKDEITIVEGIPVTTVPRTIFDIAAVVPRNQLERAMNEAEFRRLTDPLSLDDLLDRYQGRPGTPAIREILAQGRLGAAITRSELEDRFLALLDQVELPRPELNVYVETTNGLIECDCVWRHARLVVELDGRAAHARQAAFERDRARDRALQTAGWRVVRITWRQLHEDAASIAADLASLLSGAPLRS